MKRRLSTPEGLAKFNETFAHKGRDILNTNHPLKGTHCSDETREKMSIAKLGKKKSEETKKRMSDAQLKYKNENVVGEETKRKISENSAHNKKVLAINTITGQELEFRSVKYASLITGIGATSIYLATRGKRKSVKGYMFKYLET